MLTTSLAIGAGKLAASLSTRFHLGSGTSLPGKVARKIDPALLRNLSQQVREQVIAVTGTNGKSTTCGLLAQFIREAHKTVVHNQLGANMVPGITAALLHQSSITGKLDADYAVLEVDEASLKGLTKEVTVQQIVVTNLFRDQLDRYGELDTTAKLIAGGIQQTGIMQGQGQLILNADDPLVTLLGKDLPTPPLYFGIETVEYLHPTSVSCPVAFTRETTQCPQCNQALEYNTMTFGHLGDYHCAACGYHRPVPTVAASHVLVRPEASDIILKYGDQTLQITLALPGLFNVYNFLAAVAVIYNLGLSADVITSGLQHYQSIFGRAERKTLQGKDTLIMLIKNPVGASEVLKLVAGDPKGHLLIALNDNYADGRDVSWIWDAQFEVIPLQKSITVSGVRAEDMAIRLKYAGIPETQITVERDLKQALNQALSKTNGGETLYVLPTYTALLDLNKMLN